MENANPLYVQILSLLRQNLEEGKFKQSDIGRRLGINQSSVSLLLNGRSRMGLEQALALCDLMSIPFSDIAMQAERASRPAIKMTTELEEAMFKSPVHVLAYSAATRNVRPSDLKLKKVSVLEVERAFEDLERVGVLKKVGKSAYTQTSKNVRYEASHRLRSTKPHVRILQKTLDRYDEDVADGTRMSPRMNWFEVDRFTTAQVKEIESNLFALYHKIDAFQKYNQMNNYKHEDNMILWNLNILLYPATDRPYV